RPRQRGLRADRLLPRLPGLAQERERRGQGAAAVLLGRRQGRLTPRSWAALTRARGAPQRACADHARCLMACRDRDVHFMNRTAFLKSVTGAGVLAAAGGLATPPISHPAAPAAVGFVPPAELAHFHSLRKPPYVRHHRPPVRRG